jgi:HAD superfamily hydrolase (TIGR01509 family)
MPLPFRPAAVVFDMDGVLFDTEALYEKAILAAAKEAGQDFQPTLFRRLLGGAWLENRAVLLNHFGDTFPIDELHAAWMRHFDAMVDTQLRLKPGAVELLDTLDVLRLPRAIATSSFHRHVQHHLAVHGLAGRFNVIVANGDYVANKPAPDPFLKAAEHLHTEPRLCLALEDSYNGVRSASSAGMMTVMVPDLLEPTDAIRSLCTEVAIDLHMVSRLIATAICKQVVPPPGNTSTRTD